MDELRRADVRLGLELLPGDRQHAIIPVKIVVDREGFEVPHDVQVRLPRRRRGQIDAAGDGVGTLDGRLTGQRRRRQRIQVVSDDLEVETAVVLAEPFLGVRVVGGLDVFALREERRDVDLLRGDTADRPGELAGSGPR